MNNGAKIRDILGIRVVSSQIKQVLKRIETEIEKSDYNRPFFVVTVNSEFVMLAQDDAEFKRILNSADLAIPDGVGLKLTGIENIVPGRKVVEELLKLKVRTFYLGGKDRVAQEMAKKFGGEWDEGEENIKIQITNNNSNSNIKILNKINKYMPDLLLVAYGAPWQEKWLFANRQKLKAKVVMGVGGTFDYLTGKARLPPVWMEKAGLEWLWRLIHEPWRWRRQLNLLRFAYKILISKS